MKEDLRVTSLEGSLRSQVQGFSCPRPAQRNGKFERKFQLPMAGLVNVQWHTTGLKDEKRNKILTVFTKPTTFSS
jgi:hypothetical protein